MTATLERHLPTVAVVVVLAGLLSSLLNRPSDSKPVTVKASAATSVTPEDNVVDADLGLKPMAVPRTTRPDSGGDGVVSSPPLKTVLASESVKNEEQALSMPFLWGVDLGEMPPIESRLPHSSPDPEPYHTGTGHPAQGFKIAVIFSGQLDRDTYNRDDRDTMHRELAEFAETYGYDLAIDIDAVRGRALRPVYFASEKVDRTVAFNRYLESH